MKKVKLKLFELINLNIELNGFTAPDTGEVRVEGLLNQKLSYSTKYQLKASAKGLESEKEMIDEVQNELIQKYGNIDQHGNVGLNRIILDEDGNQKINPHFIEYQQEWNKFVTENEREVEFYELSIEELKDVVTKDNYIVIDQYFVKTNE